MIPIYLLDRLDLLSREMHRLLPALSLPDDAHDELAFPLVHIMGAGENIYLLDHLAD